MSAGLATAVPLEEPIVSGWYLSSSSRIDVGEVVPLYCFSVGSLHGQLLGTQLPRVQHRKVQLL